MRSEGFIRTGHDPGDPMVCAHCPFCGSGQILGQSDGNISCQFCGMAFLVRVQPAFSGMPQDQAGPGALTGTGPDVMPGGPGGLPPGLEDGEGLPPEAGGEDALPWDDDDEGGDEDGDRPPWDDDDEGPPSEDGEGPPEKGKKKGRGKDNPFGKKSYRTLAGDVLPEDAYVRHLAVLASGGSSRVLAMLRNGS